MDTRIGDDSFRIYVSEDAAPGLGAALAEVEALVHGLELVDSPPDFGRPGAVPAARDLVKRDRLAVEATEAASAALRSGLGDISRSALGHVTQLAEADAQNAGDLRAATAERDAP